MSILSLEQVDQIKGHLYKIINSKDNKIYIGQTRSHRKNKGKYREFGYIGRFKDHISEAIKNTKYKQCSYLNNAIRKDRDFFKVELLEECNITDLDEKEKFYIKKYNSYYPSGYNLTKGGKCYSKINIEKNQEIKDIVKRGREFGYKHSKETKDKIKQNLNEMKDHLKLKASSLKRKKEVSDIITKFYDNKKIEKISKFKIDENVEKHIRPMYDKNKNIISYKIYFDRNNVYKSQSKFQTPEVIYNRLKHILNKAKEISKNC